jgi:threonine synthase
VADETLRAAKNGAVYASHAYLAHVMAGYATIAYELVEQLGAEPASVIVPAGQGSLLLGIGRGFISLQKGGKIKHLPQLIGVQAKACAPLACLYHNRHDEHVESFTLAEGVRIPKPLRAKTVVEMVKQTRGDFIEVNEEQLMNGYQQLARRGLYVEPTSALVWEGLMRTLNKLTSPIICILTGSGLKWIPTAEN